MRTSSTATDGAFELLCMYGGPWRIPMRTSAVMGPPRPHVELYAYRDARAVRVLRAGGVFLPRATRARGCLLPGGQGLWLNFYLDSEDFGKGLHRRNGSLVSYSARGASIGSFDITDSIYDASPCALKSTAGR